MSCNHVSLSQKRKKYMSYDYNVTLYSQDICLLKNQSQTFYLVMKMKFHLQDMGYVEPDLEDLVVQRDFWSSCIIVFLLDYRKFSVSRLQHLINFAWRIRRAISIVGRELYFYIFYFEFLEDLMHIYTEGPWEVDGALLVLERWRPNLVIRNLQLKFILIWV